VKPGLSGDREMFWIRGIGASFVAPLHRARIARGTRIGREETVLSCRIGEAADPIREEIFAGYEVRLI